MWRSLVLYLCIGLALVGLRRVVSGAPAPQPQTLVVPVAPGATAAEVERAVDDALLAAFAERAGWVHADEVVRDRLVQNVRFVEPDGIGSGDAERCLAHALALGMHKSDPGVRARLAWLAREVLARIAAEEPSDAELETYLADHAERFARAATVTFSQVFLGATERAERLASDADALGRALATQDEPQGLRSSDPSLLPATLEHASEARIDALFGKGFGALVLAAPERRWSGPVRSSYGLHFLWARTRTAAEPEALAAVRPAVREAWQHDHHDAWVRAALGRMRAAYRIELVTDGVQPP